MGKESQGKDESWVAAISPGPGRSERCRLLRREVGKLPLERRRWRQDSIAAGATIPGGGCFPSRLYKSSISFFCSVCSASTSDKCLRMHGEQGKASQTLCSPRFASSSAVFPRLTSAEGSAAEPRTPRLPRCSLTPHCSDTDCCRSSSSTLGWGGSRSGNCPQVGVPSLHPFPHRSKPPGPQLRDHSLPEPPWSLVLLQHCPLCLSSLRSAEGLEALGIWRELGMLVAGEALLVPWMKSLGNGQQAGASLLGEDKEEGEEDRSLAGYKALG